MGIHYEGSMRPRWGRAVARVRASRPGLGAVAELAGRQSGVVARWQLLDAGVAPGTVDSLVQRGLLIGIHPGVYAYGHVGLLRDARLLAAAIRTRETMLSHHSAAELWGAREERGGPIHTLTPGHGRHRVGGLVIHRARWLDPSDRVVRRGIPVTSVPRTLLDLAAVDQRELRRVLNEVLRLDLTDAGALAEVARRYRGHPGRRRLLGLLARDREPRLLRSDLEFRFLELCRRAGLPEPEMNTVVAGYEADAWWPDNDLVVELDGWEYHRDRASFERDRKRDEDLQRRGIRVVRITWRRLLESPHEVEATIAELTSGIRVP